MIGQMIMVGFLGDHERDPGVIAVRDQLANGIDRRRGALSGEYRLAQRASLADRVPAQRQVRNGAVHRGRPGRRQGAAADTAERPPLFSLGVERRQKPGLCLGRQRRAALRDHGRGAGLCRLQSQFRPGGRSQRQSRQSGDRPARPQLQRRSQYRHGARPRLHPRPSRCRHRHGGQALPGPRLKPCRQPQGAGRRVRELAGDRDRALP